jgi:pimeloyl-ACP methyl ester carboxylesterase
MECSDWGERSPRWAGIRSQTVEVCGSSVHFLTADASRPEAPTHLLVHSTPGSATNWLDTIRPLTAHGQVIAPDLPGTLAGHTASPHRSAARAEINARFLRAFTATLGLRDVLAHGWSMGGLVALLFAGLAPGRVGGLVLVAPALPGPLSAAQALGWQTLGRLTVSAGPPVLRGLLRLTGRRLLELNKRRHATPEALSAYDLAYLGGDPSRLSHDITPCGRGNLTGYGLGRTACLTPSRPSPLRSPRCMSNDVPSEMRSTGCPYLRCCFGVTRTL